MNAKVSEKHAAAQAAGPSAEQGISEKLQSRESQELILAFSGAIGAGIDEVIPLFKEELERLAYRVPPRIKVSALIRKHAPRLLDRFSEHRGRFADLDSVSGLDRYTRFQDAGNAMREHYGHDILAQLTMAHIATDEKRVGAPSPHSANQKVADPVRVAFIIDSLKHPEEVRFLRQVYGNNVYLIGVLSAETHRSKRLQAETGKDAGDVKKLIDRDRIEDIDHGQQLDKALKLSDFFVRNSPGNLKGTEEQIRRFCHLMHGAVKVTPTTEEFGMYVAYSSALSSACMSRQVGASILSRDGTVLATGCNDVPRAGGGLYPNKSKGQDFRCVMSDGICHNDAEKDLIRREIERILTSEGITPKRAADIASTIKSKTRLGDLIEFSRAVHAEMDALISVARKGSGSVVGATLFTTTYPCHNCARHILASGVRRVLYIEPYEKSLAVALHADAIVHDAEPTASSEEEPSQIPFLHFEGVAPRRYQELFLFPTRKKEGKRLQIDLPTARKKIPQMLDAYRDVEAKVVQLLVEQHVIERETTNEPPSAA